MRRLDSTMATLAVGALCACSSGGGGATPPPVVTETCTEAAPCALVPGTPVTGDITGNTATSAQVDAYRLDASGITGRTVLTLTLTEIAPATPVRLVFLLEDDSGEVPQRTYASRGPIATGPQALTANFVLPAAKKYRVVVRDSLNKNNDPHNGYTLTAALQADPDTGEPDDTIGADGAIAADPAHARALTLGATPATCTGFIAEAGDVDLCTFTVPAPGAIVQWGVQRAGTGGPLRLKTGLYASGGSAALFEADAPSAGAQPVPATTARFLAAGAYLIQLRDFTGSESDFTASAKWTATVQLLADPDPSEGATRNDTPATATTVSAGAAVTTVTGAIGSQGDVDWYQIYLGPTSTAQLLQITLDPQQSNQDVDLSWAAGDFLNNPPPTPASGAPCDLTCPGRFCQQPDAGTTASPYCLYTGHAVHRFPAGATGPQVVRIRHLGPAETVRVVVEDFGDQRWTTKTYQLSAQLLPDPDPNEQAAFNDTFATATHLDGGVDADGGLHFATAGALGSWDYIDANSSAERASLRLRADVDWYRMPLPPRTLAPACPPPIPLCGNGDGGTDGGDAGVPDGGTGDGGASDGGITCDDGGLPPGDAGLCTPAPDGGRVYLPRPDYGIQLRWSNADESVYNTFLQGSVAFDGGPACIFSVDNNGLTASDGGYVRPAAGDKCLCLPASQGNAVDDLWMRLDAPLGNPTHRPNAPEDQNAYSDKLYGLAVDLAPGALQTICDGGCALPQGWPSACPGN